MSIRKQRTPLPCKPAPISILLRDELARRCGCHPQTIENRLRKSPNFPKPTRIGALRVWTEADVAVARAVLQAKGAEPASITTLLA